MILENKYRDPIINRVNAPEVNGTTKYEDDPLNIVGCTAVTTAGSKHCSQSACVFIKFQSATGS